MSDDDKKPEGSPETKVEAPVVDLSAVALAEAEVEQAQTKKGKSEFRTIKPEDIKSGMMIRVHQKITETNTKGEDKERIQVFQGMVLSHKHGNEPGATITVRKVSGTIGVERIFPIHSPKIEKFELVRQFEVSQSRPYYLRTYKKRLTEIKK